MAFKHLDLNCHLDFDIWNLVYGIATHLSGARNDKKRGFVMVMKERIPSCLWKEGLAMGVKEGIPSRLNDS